MGSNMNMVTATQAEKQDYMLKGMREEHLFRGKRSTLGMLLVLIMQQERKGQNASAAAPD